MEGASLLTYILHICGTNFSFFCLQLLEAFGFCEYKEPESTLRALRLLHELLLGDKKLLVKVDAKTKAQLDEWKAKKRSANGVSCSPVVWNMNSNVGKLSFYALVSSACNMKGDSGGSKNDDEDEEEVLDEETLRRDQVVKGAIEVLIREYATELNAPSQDPDSQPRNKKRKEKKEEVVLARCVMTCDLLVVISKYLVCLFFPPLCLLLEEDINAMEMEDDKRDLISREISKFRDTHKVMYQTAVSNLGLVGRFLTVYSILYQLCFSTAAEASLTVIYEVKSSTFLLLLC